MRKSEEICLDFDRTQRINMPEAVYCEGKTTDQCLEIVQQMLENENSDDAVIATRATEEQFDALLTLQPDAAKYSTLSWRHRPSTDFTVGIVSAGTSDVRIASESRITLEALGHSTFTVTDVGVSGLHRLTEVLPSLKKADVLVAIAGMEGSMPTVLAGLVPQPIVGVPTSSGYGSSLDGVTALLSMLASCAPGIAIVGIDNGFGSACVAHRISQLRSSD
ncbi:MAG: nickel pincer cofactor biosynthesis protein LarB [Acidimicrobiales bacterium]|nr:nickel pincer cofactor biosynthesis protein LarB [Acidimicrobiales bacterium]MDG1845120.1 nickel pincer cofactor biosynthesis protein LarB [Acidimicrobiales bacterium]